jgi:hypothetical protein
MYNSVAKWIFFAGLAYGICDATAARADEVCTKVRQVFIGMNDIAKKGNTKIIPFTKDYERDLTAYFDRGCPKDEVFPLPKPGPDMLLGNTSADIVAGGKIKMQMGQRLIR